MSHRLLSVSYITIILLCWNLSLPAYGWNSVGHRLVAQIALDNVDDATKKRLNQLNRSVDHSFASYSLLSAAFWLDTLYKPEHRYLKGYHYIDLPFTKDNTLVDLAPPINAVTAIRQAMLKLADKRTSNAEKGFNLRILIHVVGDIHQPLHCIAQFSSRYPKGDRGGNRVILKRNAVANNLHAYWDRGGGLLLTKNKKMSIKTIKRWAKQLEKKWPCNTDSVVLDPARWATESYKLAIQYAYIIEEYENKPSKAYKKQTRVIVEQRIALAGCRLAAALKSTM